MSDLRMRARLFARGRRPCCFVAPIALALVLAIALAAAPAVGPSAAALACAGIALDDGCLFTITGGDTIDPNDGFAVTNADGVPLWDFVQARDLQAIGYPISQRWINGLFTLQAFQKVILQWDPGKQRMNFFNTLDVLANRYSWAELPNVPPHQVLEADRGASFGAIVRNHLALLEQSAAIKERFLGEPDWLNLYGLPISYEEREVGGHPQGVQMLRAQRTVFVIWNVPAPGVTVGRVNLQNVPDKVKRLRNVIIPDAAKAPVTRDAVASLPRFVLPTLTVAARDRAALVALYNATGGPNWTSNRYWLSDAPLGEWHGVTTNDAGNVTVIRLEANRLRGTLPAALGELEFLTELVLTDNQLTGSIPPELGGLAHLKRLDLRGNQLTGCVPRGLMSVPIQMFGPSQLSFCEAPTSSGAGADHAASAPAAPVDISVCRAGHVVPNPATHTWLARDCEILLTARNALAGTARLDWSPDRPIRTWEGLTVSWSPQRVVELRLRGRGLSGQILPILGELSSLRLLDLSGNKLTGPIPASLGDLGVSYLDLGGNQLTGPIPPTFGQMASLTKLMLDRNRLSGQIPPELGQLRELLLLDLTSNQLTGPIPPELGQYPHLAAIHLEDNQLTGLIPAELGQLEKLRELYLSRNQLSGPIPPELGQLEKLGELWLQRNRLTGAIPPELRQLTRVGVMDLGRNRLTGTIPAWLGDLPRLWELNLSFNQLTGAIPGELSKATGLWNVWLQGNRLTGAIPPELGRLPNLRYLSLGLNRLTGPIPPTLGDLSHLHVLGLGGNRLTGSIPAALGRLREMRVLGLENNQLTGAIPAELGTLPNLGFIYIGGNPFTGCIPAAWKQAQDSDLDTLGLPFCR